MSLASRLEKVDDWRWRIPRDEALGMRTDVLIFASRPILDQVSRDKSLEQAANVATLPGIVGPSLAMPDIHQGYGFPIGGVAATDLEYGVVSPGGVGFDINCGVRLLRVNLTRDDVVPRIRQFVDEVFRQVPCGTGGAGHIDISRKQLDQLLAGGAPWLIREGYGEERDNEFAEAGGALEDADPDAVSEKAKERGRPQIGTLGSGNHFLEVQYVERVDDGAIAKAFALSEGQIVVLIHSGSRGLGHQVCTDSLQQISVAMKRYNITVPDRQLACVPTRSEEGQAYLGAMRAAANFAWANRQGITHFLRKALTRVFGKDARAQVVYDVCHNIAKQETHRVDGVKRQLLVHRKGATRAFPPGHREMPAEYRTAGQPVFIPGSMGTASWVLAGMQGSMEQTFGTTCHGAGRLLSRTAAQKGKNLHDVLRSLETSGIYVKSETKAGILEEIPEAYKDVDEVVEVVHQAGIARRVARLRPMGVIKG
jgi:tRNA-splicing ligase RtcB